MNHAHDIPVKLSGKGDIGNCQTVCLRAAPHKVTPLKTKKVTHLVFELLEHSDFSKQTLPF